MTRLFGEQGAATRALPASGSPPPYLGVASSHPARRSPRWTTFGIPRSQHFPPSPLPSLLPPSLPCAWSGRARELRPPLNPPPEGVCLQTERKKNLPPRCRPLAARAPPPRVPPLSEAPGLKGGATTDAAGGGNGCDDATSAGARSAGPPRWNGALAPPPPPPLPSTPQAAASATPLLGASQNSSSTPPRRAPKSSTRGPLLEASVRTASVVPCSLYRSARLLSAASAE